MVRLARYIAVILLVFGAGCKGTLTEDDRDDSFFGGSGKTDTRGVQEGSPEAIGVLAVANTVSLDVLGADPWQGVGLSERAVDNIGYFRIGDDGLAGTSDDGFFDTLAELDAIPFVGTIAFEQLLDFAFANGYVPNSGYPDGGLIDGGGVIDAGGFVDALRLIDGPAPDSF